MRSHETQSCKWNQVLLMRLPVTKVTVPTVCQAVHSSLGRKANGTGFQAARAHSTGSEGGLAKTRPDSLRWWEYSSHDLQIVSLNWLFVSLSFR